MNISDTERLIKESIICLCRNHYGVQSGEDVNFEVDGIICISFYNKKSDKYAVVKIHELITGSKVASPVNDDKNAFDSNLISDAEENCIVAISSVPETQVEPIYKPEENVTNDTAVNFPEITTALNNSTVTNKRKRKSSVPHHQSELYIDSVLPYSFKINEQRSGARNQEKSSRVHLSSDEISDDRRNLVEIKDEPVWLLDGNSMDESSANVQHCRLILSEGETVKETVNSYESDGTISDSIKYSCSQCDIICCTYDEIHKHIRYSHNVDESFICVPCKIGFISESAYSSHCKSNFCKATASGSFENSNSVCNETVGDLEEEHRYRNSEELSGDELSVNHNKILFKQTNNFSENDDCIDLESLPENFEGGLTDKSRVCSVCSLEFENFPAFNVHLTAAHSLYPCPYCEKTFPHQTERELHLYEHTGESPLECSICGLNFNSVALLNNHRKLHTQQSAKQKSNSNQTYSRRSANFADQYGSNQPLEISDENDDVPTQSNSSDAHPDPFRTFKCDVCEMVVDGFEPFSDHCAAVHQRVPCPYCGSTFSHKASMYRHQRVHTGVKPFRCRLCPQAFIRKEPLRAHMSRDHRINHFFI